MEKITTLNSLIASGHATKITEEEREHLMKSMQATQEQAEKDGQQVTNDVMHDPKVNLIEYVIKITNLQPGTTVTEALNIKLLEKDVNIMDISDGKYTFGELHETIRDYIQIINNLRKQLENK